MLRTEAIFGFKLHTTGSPHERSDMRDMQSRMSLSLSSGARSRDPLAHPGYNRGFAFLRLHSPEFCNRFARGHGTADNTQVIWVEREAKNFCGRG
jgi:hypothetical protein